MSCLSFSVPLVGFISLARLSQIESKEAFQVSDKSTPLKMMLARIKALDRGLARYALAQKERRVKGKKQLREEGWGVGLSVCL